jgi:hypothetical protein
MKKGWSCPACDRKYYSATFDRYCCIEHNLVAPYSPCSVIDCEFCSLPQTDEDVLADARRFVERHQ